MWGPQGSDRQQGDTGVTIARGTQQEPSDNEAASDDEDQWEDPQPAIDDTQSEQPSQRVNVRQQSVTRKTKVSGKKQVLNRRKKQQQKLCTEADSWQECMQNRQSWTLSSAHVAPHPSGRGRIPGIPLVARA